METRNHPRAFALLAMTLGACQIAGCTPDEEHRDIPGAQTAAVSAYGLTLDENATPQQVTYAFLRSIADDVHAAQAHQRAEQKQALRRTHALIAYAAVEHRLLAAENMARIEKKASFGKDRDEKLFDFTHQLAPIVAHYVPSFDTDFADAQKKMTLRGSPTAGTVYVDYAAAHDPSAADVRQRDPVIIDVELAKEIAGGKSYWRVAKVGFAGRPATGPASTQPMNPLMKELPAVTQPGSPTHRSSPLTGSAPAH